MSESGPAAKRYVLIGADGRPYASSTPGALGGNKRGRRYGRLDCPAARRAIAASGYVRDRVFFANEETAVAAGYRPCAACLPEEYARWKAAAQDDRIEAHLRSVDWARVEAALESDGWAMLEDLLSADACQGVVRLYDDERRFRSRVVMARHGFGRGEYKYFSYPLPDLLARLRTALYPPLVPIANRWNDALRSGVRYPNTHAEFLRRCHEADQRQATPLLLRYAAGDYNCLHQDVYGEHVFPLQVAVLLSEPGVDFTGGDFVLTEQRPRMQSRADVVPLRRGDGVVFAVNDRPVTGKRRSHRVRMRHGVSRLRSGHRHTLGLIFHDAK